MSAHGAGDHSHHQHHVGAGPRLLWALVLTLAFAGVEAMAGFWSGSLALLGDAGHMVTDSASLGLAAVATWLARRPPSKNHTYGLGRVEAIAALANVIFMLVVIVFITAAAINRFLEPGPIDGQTVTLVALIGLIVNIGVAWLLMHGEQTMNTRGALLHVMGDLFGSLAALASGAVVLMTGWTPIDPLLSLLICVLILISSARLLREILRALLEGTPAHLSVEQIGYCLATVPGVRSVHDLHIWTLTSSRPLLSAHLIVESLELWPTILAAAKHVLAERGITHVTLQPELAQQHIRWFTKLPGAVSGRNQDAETAHEGRA